MLERICGSYEYVGPNYNNKKTILIEELPKEQEKEFKEYLLKFKPNYYVIIAHGTTQTHDNIDEIAQSIGIIVDPLYIKKNGILNKKKKYEGLKPWTPEKES